MKNWKFSKVFPIKNSRKNLSTSYLLFLGTIVFLSHSCSSIDQPKLDNIPLELDVKYTHKMMAQAAIELKEQENTFLEAFSSNMSEEKLFFAQLLGINPLRAGSTTASLDTLLANNYGPLLADSSMAFLVDTMKLILDPSWDIKEQITPMLKRLSYYFGEDSLQFPAFRTHINGYIPDGGINEIDQIMVAPEYISFGMHFFLGKDFPYYPYQIPAYIRKRYTPEYLPSLLAQEIGEGMLAPMEASNQPHLLDKMVRTGIKQYLMHQILPSMPDSLLFLYSSSQMEWAYHYEAEIYKELMPLLYNTNFVVHRDFLGEKPYTSHMGQESAPRLGEFIGYRIVENFMRKNKGLSLPDLCNITDYEKLFRESSYKP